MVVGADKVDGKRGVPGPERRQLLLAAARKVFIEQGLAGARTRRIAEEAGTTETIMYRHFGSKQEMFEEAIRAPLEDMTRAINDLAPEFAEVDARGRVRISRAIVERLLEAMVEIVPLFGAAVLSDQEGGRDFYVRRIVPIIDASAQTTAQIISTFTHRELDPQLLYTALFGMLLGMALDATTRNVELDIPATATRLLDLISRGLGTDD
jgi:AcrR family transcriptional regulator